MINECNDSEKKYYLSMNPCLKGWCDKCSAYSCLKAFTCYLDMLFIHVQRLYNKMWVI